MTSVKRFERPSQLEGCSFAIGIQRTSTGGHIGLYYRPESSPVFFLHLAFHNRLRSEAIDGDYGWIECPGLSPDEAEDIGLWLAEVWARNGNRIPYGINYWRGAHFRRDGTFIPSPNGDGLTCATLVVALFEGYGLPIIDVATWPVRLSDRKFQKLIVDALEQDWLARKDANHAQRIQQQKAHIGNAARFRPAEVAHAVSVWNRSLVKFDDARAGGKQIVLSLKRLGL